MTKEQFEREKRYQMTMYIAGELLGRGAIDERDYAHIEKKCAEEYRPIFGKIFSKYHGSAAEKKEWKN